MSEWISVEDEMPPIFKDTGISFLAIWTDSGDIDGIEWYTFDGYDYWNQNSGNLNQLGSKGQMAMFTHWMPMLEPPE